METSAVISLAAVGVSLVALLLNGRKDTRSDAENTAIIKTKLDSLISGVDDIRVEMRSMKDAIGDHRERIARIESAVANNTLRIDHLEGKNND